MVWACLLAAMANSGLFVVTLCAVVAAATFPTAVVGSTCYSNPECQVCFFIVKYLVPHNPFSYQLPRIVSMNDSS